VPPHIPAFGRLNCSEYRPHSLIFRAGTLSVVGCFARLPLVFELAWCLETSLEGRFGPYSAPMKSNYPTGFRESSEATSPQAAATRCARICLGHSKWLL
jgi:hypothetical protein